ncbi:MAG: hypothetical protein GC162_07375 [Planctomycetes bacterium]|nr:hypothetical protein [Planctomycetota bacterium]
MPDPNLQFDPTRFSRQLDLSDLVRRAIVGLFIFGWIGSALPTLADTTLPYASMFAGLVGWFIASMYSARTNQFVQRAAELTNAHAPIEQIEHAIAAALPRFTMFRTVRLLIYHQLAALRHRQRRHDESAAIITALLSESAQTPTFSMRTQLLLMLAEDRLAMNDAWGAHAALAGLHQQPITLTESVQVLALQLRYEVGCGFDQLALSQLARRLSLIELMPAPVAAQCHRLLAVAARRTGRIALADYLTERADLMEPGAS